MYNDEGIVSMVIHTVVRVIYVNYGIMCTGPSGDAEGDMHGSTRG